MDARHRYLAHKTRNLLHSATLLFAMGGLLAGIGYLLGGWIGALASAAFWALSAAFSGRVSPALVLRLYGARPLHPMETPSLYRLAAALAERAELEAVPRLYYIPSAALNAISLGTPKRPYIGITDGLLRNLERRELVGVLAHEVSHIMNRDLWVMGLADSISRLTSLLSLAGQLVLLLGAISSLITREPVPWLAGLLLLVAPIFSELLQLALSRARELDADLEAANLTGDPLGLASALEKLDRAQRGFRGWIFWPVRRTPQPSLLRTHPDTRKRIERLLALHDSTPYRADHALVENDLSPPPQWVVIVQPPRRRWTGIWY